MCWSTNWAIIRVNYNYNTLTFYLRIRSPALLASTVEEMKQRTFLSCGLVYFS